jgi:hypothetical protein
MLCSGFLEPDRNAIRRFREFENRRSQYIQGRVGLKSFANGTYPRGEIDVVSVKTTNNLRRANRQAGIKSPCKALISGKTNELNISSSGIRGEKRIELSRDWAIHDDNNFTGEAVTSQKRIYSSTALRDECMLIDRTQAGYRDHNKSRLAK